jgi:AcrR family transcriptional regulator
MGSNQASVEPADGASPGSRARSDPPSSSRARLLDAATKLFLEKGYEGTSVDEIGAAAGLSGPAIYRYFKNKSELLDAVLAAAVAPMLAATAEVVAQEDDPRRALGRLVAIWVDASFGTTELTVSYTHQYPQLDRVTRARIRARHRAVTDIWTGALSRVRPDLTDAERLAMVDSAFWLIGSRAFYRSPLPPELLAQRLRTMVLGALLSEEDPGPSDRE